MESGGTHWIEQIKEFSMRRRQAYHVDQTPDKIEEVAPPKVVEKPLKKGYCRKCGEHIGRGIAFHEKRCEG